MKKRIALLVAGLFALPAAAQKAPKWVDKSRKALLTVTTFDKDNRKIHSTTGFFVSETGEALSAYAPFNGAARATVADADGNTYPVRSILGADDLYDVIRFRVAVPRKTPFLPLASDPVQEGTPVFLLPYGSATEKTAGFKQGAVTEVSKLKESYRYYKLSVDLGEGEANAPLLLSNGQVFALAQEDASGKKTHSYGVSATYVNSLQVNATDAFNTVYTRILIRKAWPSDAEQASVSLFLLAGTQDAATYLETLDDFVATFPQHPEGYLNRASHAVSKRAELADTPAGQAAFLNRALGDLQTAAKLSRNKGEVYYNQAQWIYSVATGDSTQTDPQWSLDAALAVVRKAIEEEDLPLYRELEGDIFFFRQDYPAAYEAYGKAIAHPAASSDAYYRAAQALEKIPGSPISDLIVLMDSAILRMGTPLPRNAAPYVLERVEYKVQLSLFSEALEDYNLYYSLTDGEVNDRFYYYREQARFRTGDHEGALHDIQQALALNPEAPDYYAEEAAIYVRLQQYEEALLRVRKALELAPDFAACYRIRGVCLLRSEKKAEACEAFTKAKDLGDPVVARLIREHCR